MSNPIVFGKGQSAHFAGHGWPARFYGPSACCGWIAEQLGGCLGWHNTEMPVRRRLLFVLFGGSALGTIGYLAAVTVTAIAAENITGSARWAGVPAAVATLGAAAGAGSLSRLMEQRGRRVGLIAGLVIAAVGSGISAYGVVVASIGVLVVGMFALGFGRASYQLARYAAADLQPPDRRASAISWMVWAGTFGSILGPQLLAPGERMGESLFGSGLSGPFVLAGVTFGLAGLAWFVLLRPDPTTLAHQADEPDRPAISNAELLRRPNVWVAVAAMWFGQFVMVEVMAMTPVFLSSIGETLLIVGQVISLHTLGMFAFSPVTGWLTTKFGSRSMIAAGVAVLLSAAGMGWFGADGNLAILYPALFLLGLGWNFTFVAGSSLLIEGLAPGEGVQLQGWADAGVWVAGGVANVAAGVILDIAGFPTLNVVAGVLALVPALALFGERFARRPARVGVG